jgi:putative flippase GtrA
VDDTRILVAAPTPLDLRAAVRAAIAHPIARFAAVGAVSTVAYAVLYLALRGGMGAAGANVVALCLTAVGNTAANRRATFGVRGRAGIVRHQLQGAALLAVALAITSGAVAALHAASPDAPRTIELTVLVLANLCATAGRFIALRSWVFARR